MGTFNIVLKWGASSSGARKAELRREVSHQPMVEKHPGVHLKNFIIWLLPFAHCIIFDYKVFAAIAQGVYNLLIYTQGVALG